MGLAAGQGAGRAGGGPDAHHLRRVRLGHGREGRGQAVGVGQAWESGAGARNGGGRRNGGGAGIC